MSKRARRNHAPAFKAKVALAAIKGEKTLADLAQQFDIHSNQITQWKAQLLEGAAGVFGVESSCEISEPDRHGYRTLAIRNADMVFRLEDVIRGKNVRKWLHGCTYKCDWVRRRFIEDPNPHSSLSKYAGT